jgi:hypothetical protein
MHMTLRAPLRSEPPKNLKRRRVKLYGTCCTLPSECYVYGVTLNLVYLSCEGRSRKQYLSV